MGAIPWQHGSRGFMSVNGIELEYATFGEKQSELPTIVMLHEGLGCVSTWRDFPDQVAKATGCAVFVYSRAGYGKSSPSNLPRPLDYMTREALDVLPEVLNQIEAKPYILLGHSDGASIAAIYGGSVEDFRVRGLILIAPHFFTEPEGLAAIRKAKSAYENGDLKERLSRHHSDADNAFRGWNDAWLDPEFKAWDITEVIDYWRIPVLGIQGDRDEYGSLKQIAVMSERSYAPVDELIIPDCGHSPHKDNAVAAISGITEFVGRLSRIESERVETG